MRFGKSKEEAEQEPNRAGGGGGDFIKYLQPGDTTFRIMQDPDDWCYYWEHFSPEGFSFACNNEENCPGCTSENEKMKKVSRKVAFNVLQGWQGVEYINVYKIGPMVAEKLENRYKRLDTLTDRDYTINKYKTAADRWDFDVEGSTPTPVDKRKYELKDIEKMLMEQWEERFGGGGEKPVRRTTIAPASQPEEPPFEEKVIQEADLRKMDPSALLNFITTEFHMTPPSSVQTTDQMVDWLMELQS